MRVLLLIFTALFTGLPASAQTPMQSEMQAEMPVAAVSQDYCISVMASFPTNDTVPRYQFFKLTEQLAVGATTAFKAAVSQYGDGDVQPDEPVIEVIEAIANPVIRQAAPELTVAFMGHLINFAEQCDTYINGQLSSLTAFNADLALDDGVITEDALYLRQILSDSLLRLGADQDPIYAQTMANYSASLENTRNDIEFAAYASEIDDLEALYMTDLDGRLARSNDIINSEINRETLGDAVTMSEDMNREAKEQDKRRRIETLLRILSRY